MLRGDMLEFLESSALLIKRITLNSSKEFLVIFLHLGALYRGNDPNFHCKEQIIKIVKSIMLPAPQMAAIAAMTNNVLTTTFMTGNP